MQVLRVGQPLLEKLIMTENPIQPVAPIGEPMVDARHACYALNLPLYWFSDPKMREKKRIPHYCFGHTVRFRLSELEAWYEKHGVKCGGKPLPTRGSGNE